MGEASRAARRNGSTWSTLSAEKSSMGSFLRTNWRWIALALALAGLALCAWMWLTNDKPADGIYPL
jgi:hypothetical protein